MPSINYIIKLYSHLAKINKIIFSLKENFVNLFLCSNKMLFSS